MKLPRIGVALVVCLSLGVTGCGRTTDSAAGVGEPLTTVSTIVAESTEASATESAAKTTTVEPSPSTTRQPDVPVNPAAFERAGMSVFTYVLGGYAGTCAISPHGATCKGTTPVDAPMVTAVPLPPRQADAIYIGEDGMHFTLFEGVGPSQGTLHPGQSITVNDNSCRYVDDRTLQCASGSDSFVITADGSITPHGVLNDPPVWTLPDEY